MLNKLFTILIVVSALAVGSFAQTTGFTYQGSLKDGANAANGNYDFEFRLFNLLNGGGQQGFAIQRQNVAVANGIFTVSLDFGSFPFPGADRFLEIAVRNAGSGGFTILDPRQKLGSSPYAVKSVLAETANNATTATTASNALQLGGIAANQFVQTADPRLLDARPPTAGSPNYVQNTTSPQASTNFNISGTGTANIISATTQYNIGTDRVLSSVIAQNNLFVGVGAGQTNAQGVNNTFIGRGAGFSNTNGQNNSFFGSGAGAPSVGTSNSFFGREAGRHNTTGGGNSFFGYNSGSENTTGILNAFFGNWAGRLNTTGSNNTAIGVDTDFGAGNLTYATAIGSGAVVSSSNTIMLGRSDGSDTVRVPGRLALLDLGTAGSTVLCRNGLITGPQIATCSSSLRYKTNIGRFSLGLNLINRLKPITFDWKEGGMHDLGLGAEDVAAIEPLLVTYNAKGEVEGVKYDRISVVLVNAIKEQQAQIEAQQKLIDQQRAENESLKARISAIETLLMKRP